MKRAAQLLTIFLLSLIISCHAMASNPYYTSDFYTETTEVSFRGMSIYFPSTWEFEFDKEYKEYSFDDGQTIVDYHFVLDTSNYTSDFISRFSMVYWGVNNELYNTTAYNVEKPICIKNDTFIEWFHQYSVQLNETTSMNVYHVYFHVIDTDLWLIAFYAENTDGLQQSRLIDFIKSIDSFTYTPEKQASNVPASVTNQKIKYDNLIYEGGFFDLYYYGSSDTYVYYILDNKTDITLTIQADAISINGISFNNFVFSDDVAPQSAGMVSAKMGEPYVHMTEQNVGGSFRVFSFQDRNFDRADFNVINIPVKPAN